MLDHLWPCNHFGIPAEQGVVDEGSVHRSQVDLRLMRVEHFDLALRHNPQHLLLRRCYDRLRHQREGQRKHC